MSGVTTTSFRAAASAHVPRPGVALIPSMAAQYPAGRPGAAPVRRLHPSASTSRIAATARPPDCSSTAAVNAPSASDSGAPVVTSARARLWAASNCSACFRSVTSRTTPGNRAARPEASRSTLPRAMTHRGGSLVAIRYSAS